MTSAELKPGDILVYKGTDNKDPHWKNFVKGSAYKIQQVSEFEPTLGVESSYVTFVDFKWGSLGPYIPVHFVTLAQWRENRIEEILDSKNPEESGET